MKSCITALIGIINILKAFSNTPILLRKISTTATIATTTATNKNIGLVNKASPILTNCIDRPPTALVSDPIPEAKAAGSIPFRVVVKVLSLVAASSKSKFAKLSPIPEI